MLAWVVSAALLGQPLPIFAAIAALLVVQPSVNQSLSRGIERSIGVILGVIVASVADIIFGTSSAVVLAVIVVSLLIGWALRLGPASATQIPISGMLMLSIGVATPNYAFDRILETVIGAAVAMLVNAAIAPPVLLVPAHTAVGRLLEHSAATLERLSLTLSQKQDAAGLEALMVQARSLRSLDAAAAAAIAAAAESLTLNPRRGKHRRILKGDAELHARLSVLVRRLIGMSRAVHDHYDSSLHQEPIVRDLARELSKAAHDLRLLHSTEGVLSAPPQDDQLPALTAPLSVPRPHPTHWVLIGSLLEDMRRVREEIIGDED
ncbi:MAG: hypothetical protein JWQ43_2772 [Glaciihabitans sp.]|nr:hypothetical protein [Glaciihabitans sp.]